jgi:hypothetical protein
MDIVDSVNIEYSIHTTVFVSSGDINITTQSTSFISQEGLIAPNFVVESKLLLRNREVPILNLSPENDCTKVLRRFPQSLKANSGIHQIRPQPLPSTSLRIHQSPISLLFDAII